MAPSSYPEPQPTFIDRVHNYIDTQPSIVKFDAAFLERRMQAHREWQAQLTAELATGIILEVAMVLDESDVA